MDLEQNVTSIIRRERVSLAASVRLNPIVDCSDEDNSLMHRPSALITPSSWNNATTSFWWERKTTSDSIRNRAVLPKRVNNKTPWWMNDDITAGTTETSTQAINYDKLTTESSRMTTAPPPKDYEEFPGVGYYKSTKKILSWDDARKECKEDGAHLMVIDTDQKKEVFKILYLRQWPKVSSDGTYLVNLVGVHDPEKTGHFVTVLGDPVEKSRWARGQPDGGDQHCGAARWTGELHDISCSMKSAFICEISL
ncbi:hemolymph lipopolysaccharide-binding protein [Anabrus simplex]|uniref:hemolymph lipopolysaccharide-binding protein n=1 Tax=Anabrus simplex TaxID=316456 RepID=UPI0035A29AF4